MQADASAWRMSPPAGLRRASRRGPAGRVLGVCDHGTTRTRCAAGRGRLASGRQPAAGVKRVLRLDFAGRLAGHFLGRGLGGAATADVDLVSYVWNRRCWLACPKHAQGMVGFVLRASGGFLSSPKKGPAQSWRGDGFQFFCCMIGRRSRRVVEAKPDLVLCRWEVDRTEKNRAEEGVRRVVGKSRHAGLRWVGATRRGRGAREVLQSETVDVARSVAVACRAPRFCRGKDARFWR